jgi:FlgD Ig-like domain
MQCSWYGEIGETDQGLVGTMKSKFFILFFAFVSICSMLFSTSWYVKQDGTADFTTIMEALDSGNTGGGDSIIVHPGIYYENLEIDYNESSLTLSSLYPQTGDESYIYNTIIDGNQNGSAVYIDNTLMFRMMGFTIRNGSGHLRTPNTGFAGGGIYSLDNTSCVVYKCIISNNSADDGGGIYVDEGEISLYNTTIKSNHAYRLGGGIALLNASTINFYEDYPCNIYLNYAAIGCELKKAFDCPPLTVYVDTFTVAQPDRYFVCDRDQYGVPMNDISMNIQNVLFEPVSADIFVSPNGNNSNNGLTADDPIQSINLAYSMIESDSLNPHTIHLSEGIYLPGLNDQKYPIQTRGYISLIGESVENTILDAEYTETILYQTHSNYNFSIENMTIKHGENRESGNNYNFEFITFLSNNDSIYFNNLVFSECSMQETRLSAAIRAYRVNAVFNNIDVSNNQSYGFAWDNADTSVIKRCLISNCKLSNNEALPLESIFMMHFGGATTGPLLNQITIINTEITNNVSYYSDWPRTPVAMLIQNSKVVNIINCTIGHNEAPSGSSAITAQEGPTINIYNSILYGDTDREIYLENTSSQPCSLYVTNSLLEGSQWNVGLIGNNFIDWDENTSLNENPLWVNTGDYPFQLATGSPCIDAGTLDLPAGIELPEFDLAGNPRIYGNTIDMGAYEWQGVEAEEDDIIVINETRISNFPNPFNPNTTIKLELAEAGKTELAIYNVKGQKVKTLIDAFTNKGTFETNWNGKDEKGKSVSSGQYVVKLQQNGKETATKIMLLK